MAQLLPMGLPGQGSLDPLQSRTRGVRTNLRPRSRAHRPADHPAVLDEERDTSLVMMPFASNALRIRSVVDGPPVSTSTTRSPLTRNALTNPSGTRMTSGIVAPPTGSDCDPGLDGATFSSRPTTFNRSIVLWHGRAGPSVLSLFRAKTGKAGRTPWHCPCGSRTCPAPHQIESSTGMGIGKAPHIRSLP
jgi:hypothetical protein